MAKTLTFASTAERDAYIGANFPERELTDVPGLYELPGGDRLGVFCETVTVYSALSELQSIEALAARETIELLREGGAR